MRSDVYRLPGILTIPKNSTTYPIVIFVHGSGPNDRDETIGPNAIFKDLAHGLAVSGIASLRYDKRTLVYGMGAFKDSLDMTLDSEALIDVKAAIDTLKEISGTKQIFILGHSLGAMLAPKIATSNKEVDGIIMLAGNARPLQELIVEQTKYLLNADGWQEDDTEKMTELLHQTENLDSLRIGVAKTSMQYPLVLPAPYWASVLAYNQLVEVKRVNVSILVLQGERDYQVTMKDFELWKNALKLHERVTFYSYPKLNHLFLEGQGLSYPLEYHTPSNVPTYVINDITQWILGVN